MMRLAYFSPLPPASSGIADYSHELLPYLARYAEIDLFVDEGFTPAKEISKRFPIQSYRDYGSLRQTEGYEATIYHIGNDTRYHEHIYHTALKYPGIVVLHEYMLQHLVQGMTLARGNPEGYVEEMRYCYGRTGERLARLQINTGRGVDVWAWPLFERIVDASLGVVVHSEHARQQILARRPQARVAKINSHCSENILTGQYESPLAAREALGLPRDAFIVASFGLITPHKRVEVALRAFARLHRRFPDAKLLLVGAVSPLYDIQSILDGGLREGVTVTRRVNMESFLQYMIASNLAVNLRYPTGGETSATLIRLLGFGKPVIVSNVGSFVEYPDDCCAKVDVGDEEEDTLYAMMSALATDEGLRRQLGDNAHRYIQTHHTLESSAQGYIGFIQDILASPPRPSSVIPSMVRPIGDDVLAGLISDIAAEMVGLGIRDGDETILREIATALVGLNMDLPV
ncbi:MAG: glycosyltransferase [Chloroflexota bacterium]